MHVPRNAAYPSEYPIPPLPYERSMCAHPNSPLTLCSLFSYVPSIPLHFLLQQLLGSPRALRYHEGAATPRDSERHYGERFGWETRLFLTLRGRASSGVSVANPLPAQGRLALEEEEEETLQASRARVARVPRIACIADPERR